MSFTASKTELITALTQASIEYQNNATDPETMKATVTILGAMQQEIFSPSDTSDVTRATALDFITNYDALSGDAGLERAAKAQASLIVNQVFNTRTQSQEMDEETRPASEVFDIASASRLVEAPSHTHSL